MSTTSTTQLHWLRLVLGACLIVATLSVGGLAVAGSCDCDGHCDAGCTYDACCGCGSVSSECECCGVDEDCSATGGPGVANGRATCTTEY